MKIAMFASEANPFAKTGGLADVVGSLSSELAKGRHDVIVGMPLYESMWAKEGFAPELVMRFPIYMSWRRQEATIFRTLRDGVVYYFVQNQYYFGREKCYGFDDDGERFAFLALAFRHLLKVIDFKADIVHVHDWQTAIIPTLIKEKDAFDPFYNEMKFILTIHNPAFKGLLDKYFLGDYFGLDENLFNNGSVRFDNMFSTLKSGIVYADKITTVSPTHRNELLTFEGGHGLQGILELRKEDFVGILNGIKISEWSPSRDPLIKKRYNRATVVKGKHECQEDLLNTFNINWYGGPVYAIVSRLTFQKGIDLVIESGRRALKNGANLIVLGSGEYELEQKLENLRNEFPETCGIYIGYNEELAHKIYSGADFFLMPSLFEPCGISQMISHRYGTLPIVRYTGGLKDTVNGYDGQETKNKDGIGFNDYDNQGMEYAMEMSRRLYADQDKYYEVAKNAMKIDHSWKKSAKEYLSLYKSLM